MFSRNIREKISVYLNSIQFETYRYMLNLDNDFYQKERDKPIIFNGLTFYFCRNPNVELPLCTFYTHDMKRLRRERERRKMITIKLEDLNLIYLKKMKNDLNNINNK